jgi:hypothetical protein
MDMAEQSNDLIKQQKNFYRELYRRDIKGLIGIFIIMGLLVIGITYMATHRPDPTYYATSSDGALVPLATVQR